MKGDIFQNPFKPEYQGGKEPTTKKEKKKDKKKNQKLSNPFAADVLGGQFEY